MARHSTQTTPKAKTWKRREKGLPPTPQHKWNEANKLKLKAHAIVRQALRNKTLKRGRCEICQSFRVDAHHDRYDEPLNMRWLCRRHHQALHALLRKQDHLRRAA